MRGGGVVVAGAVVWAVCAGASAVRAETFLGFQVGGVLGGRGTGLTAMEDLNYTGGPPDRHAATGSAVAFDPSPMASVRFGHYFDALPGFGIEASAQYTRLRFKRQDVTVTLVNHSVGGYSSFTEDQLSADFHMFTGAVDVLYRFRPIGGVLPYVGAGPTVHGFVIRGSGDSCHIVSPAPLTRDFCSGGQMISKGTGIGFNVKAGLEVPLNDRLSFDVEYKFDYARMRADWFRSFSDVSLGYAGHTVAAGLRLKF